jgi:uncharacterized membrane protein
MIKNKFSLLCATIAGYTLFNSLSVPKISDIPEALQFNPAAYAARSGGRSRGGSFNRSPARSNSPSRNQGSDPGGNPGGGTVFVPGGGYYGGGYYGGGGSSVGGFVLLIIALMLLGGTGFVIWMLLQANKGKKKGIAGGELENDIVTVSKIQVALLAEGRAIQSQLAEIVQNADTETPEGLQQEVQEAVLALLRMPENWSHVLASSETVKSREEAERLFNQRSMAERGKYSTETLTNVGGKLAQKEYTIDPEKEPASYIVVTLLLGTADDQPLFKEIRSTEALKEALEKLASVNTEYLMVFELIWTPQADGDSLTYDEMLMEYPDMLQI